MWRSLLKKERNNAYQLRIFTNIRINLMEQEEQKILSDELLAEDLDDEVDLDDLPV